MDMEINTDLINQNNGFGLEDYGVKKEFNSHHTNSIIDLLDIESFMGGNEYTESGSENHKEIYNGPKYYGQQYQSNKSNTIINNNNNIEIKINNSKPVKKSKKSVKKSVKKSKKQVKKSINKHQQTKKLRYKYKKTKGELWEYKHQCQLLSDRVLRLGTYLKIHHRTSLDTIMNIMKTPVLTKEARQHIRKMEQEQKYRLRNCISGKNDACIRCNINLYITAEDEQIGFRHVLGCHCIKGGRYYFDTELVPRGIKREEVTLCNKCADHYKLIPGDNVFQCYKTYCKRFIVVDSTWIDKGRCLFNNKLPLTFENVYLSKTSCPVCTAELSFEELDKIRESISAGCIKIDGPVTLKINKYGSLVKI